MADPAALSPTGRRVRGYISDLVELSGKRSLWTAIVYHEDFRSDPAISAAVARSEKFLEMPMISGLKGLGFRAPGVLGYETGETRAVRELLGASEGGIGWRAALQFFAAAAHILAKATEVGAIPSHGSLDPHRVLIDYSGAVSVLGYGLPRLDLVDYLDDPTLSPAEEALRFTAPESLEGAEEDLTTDLFVLALITAELATGTPLYSGKGKALLDTATEGEGRKALSSQGPPDAIEALLGPYLEPWPDDRPATPSTLAEQATAIVDSLEGPTLAEAAESLAETASDVELDLPRGWSLPLPPSETEPEPAGALQAVAERAAAAAEQAVNALGDLPARIEEAESSDWTVDENAAKRFGEAKHHVTAAAQASREAEEAASAAERTGTVATAEPHAAAAEDAASRAMGAVAEAERALGGAIADLGATEERVAAAIAHRTQVDETTEVLEQLTGDGREKVTALVREAPGLAHPTLPRVAKALKDLARLAADADNALEALSGLELEPEDSPDQVTEAAHGHFAAIEAASKGAANALQRALSADQAETARRQATKAATDLVLTDRRATLDALRGRLEQVVTRAEAELDRTSKSTEGLDEAAVRNALEALTQHVSALVARRQNWAKTIGETAAITDPEEAESLTHTAQAEVEFAEADGADLPPLVAALDQAVHDASTARETLRQAREDSLARAGAAAGLARTLTSRLDALDTDPMQGIRADLTDNEELRSLARTLGGSSTRARDQISIAAAGWTKLQASEGVPLPKDVKEVEAAANEATEAVEAGEASLAELIALIAARTAEREAIDTALEEAALAIEVATGRIATAHEEVAAPLTGTTDAAVAERILDQQAAFDAAVAAMPEATSPPEDPLGARDHLLGLAKETEAATKKVQRARKSYERALVKASELVAVLREVTAQAEGAAERAARASASAHELIRGLDGEWTGAAEIQQELRLQITAADEAAANASTEAEAAANAATPKSARTHCAAAESAAADADDALATATPLNEALAALVASARADLKVADREAQTEAEVRGRELLQHLSPQREKLDKALEEAAAALENSPSTRARAAWATADEVVDHATQGFAGLDLVFESIENATSGSDAHQALGRLRDQAKGLPALVEEAAELARAAGASAREDAEASLTLFRTLDTLRDTILALGEDARSDVPTVGEQDPAELIQAAESLTTQAGHLVVAAQDATAARDAVMQSPDAETRAELTQAAEDALERATAAANTVTALKTKAKRVLEAWAVTLEQRRTSATIATRDQLAAGEAQLEEARISLQLAQNIVADTPELESELEGVVTEIEAIERGVEALHEHAEVASTTTAAGTAEAALEASNGVREEVDVHQTALAAALAALQARKTELVALRERAHAEAMAALEAHQGAALTHIERMRTLLAAARGKLNEVEPVLAESPARGAPAAWQQANEAHRAAAATVANAELILSALPAEVSSPSELEQIEQQVGALRELADEVQEITGSIAPTLNNALQSAAALSGILDQAVAVRERYENLEKKLGSAKQRLQASMGEAEKPKTLSARTRAETLFEELTQALAEAKPSLDELADATTAREAEALLEVAKASLDITDPVFGFGLPLVERAIDLADAETADRASRRQILIEATERFSEAIRDVPDLDAFVPDIQALNESAAEAGPTVADALSAVHTAHITYKEGHGALTALATSPLSDRPDPATKQAAEAREVRTTLDAGNLTLQAAIEHALKTLATAEEAAAEHAGAVLKGRSRWEAAVEHLIGYQARALATLADAEAITHGFEQPTADAMHSLSVTLDTLQALDSGAEPPPDDLEAIRTAADKAEAAVSEAAGVDLARLLAPIRAAKEQAIEKAATLAARIAEVSTRLLDTSAALTERQERTRFLMTELEAILIPEAAETWAAFTATATPILDAAVPELGDDPEATLHEVEQVEALVAQGASIDDAADAFRDSVEEGTHLRDTVRTSLDRHHERLAARVRELDAVIEQATDRYEHPPAEAAFVALTQAHQALSGAALPGAPPAEATVTELTEAEEALSRTVDQALDRDHPGLITELTEALAAGLKAQQDAELAEQNARASALTAIVNAGATCKTRVQHASGMLDDAPEVPPHRIRAAAHRSAARDALEAARACLIDLDAILTPPREGLNVNAAVRLAEDVEARSAKVEAHVVVVEEAIAAQVDELARLDGVTANKEALLVALREHVASIQRSIDDAPEPAGEEAIQAKAALFESQLDGETQVEQAESLSTEMTEPATADEAEERLRELTKLAEKARLLAEGAREHAAQVREASVRFAERQAAAREEEHAAALEASQLAAERAAQSLEDVGRALEEASTLATQLEEDGATAALTAIAEANDRALRASDGARAAAETAMQTSQLAPALHARAQADLADQAAIDAAEALQGLRNQVRAISQREQEDGAAQAVEARDLALPQLIVSADEADEQLRELQATIGEPDRDDAVEVARAVALEMSTHASEALDQTRESIALLMSGKPEDVADFLKEAEQAVVGLGAPVSALRAATVALTSERESGRSRRAELDLEEHRGRAWEACRLARSLSNSLATARSSLPPLPDRPSLDLQGALDQLAEIERRMWRAGQRADEARERSGGTRDLAIAKECADNAERAVGKPARWEREIDTALKRIESLLEQEPRGTPEATPIRTERMKNLRRGREPDTSTPAPQERLRQRRANTPAALPTAEEDTNPTEALLKRLRRGRSGGETGRDRLRRLREERNAEKLTPTAPPDEDSPAHPEAGYSSVADFEEFKATLVAGPEEKEEDPKDWETTDRRERLMDRLRKRSKPILLPNPRTLPPPAPVEPVDEEEGHTVMFTRDAEPEVEEDAATQMFTREMLDAAVNDALVEEADWEDIETATKQPRFPKKTD